MLKNQIPKDHAKFPFYRNLIRGEGDEEIINQKPRLGAFEVSYKGQVIFSKIKLGYWPHFVMVAQKVKKVLDADARNEPLDQYFMKDSPEKTIEGERLDGGVRSSLVDSK